ncbi:hypothetical protein T484DRAFT_1791309 [Baffinella frigidus]|nr:hypothetical protein T484DRAFT_1791309 [Cryptophyta sp. CCMP2293]
MPKQHTLRFALLAASLALGVMWLLRYVTALNEAAARDFHHSSSWALLAIYTGLHTVDLTYQALLALKMHRSLSKVGTRDLETPLRPPTLGRETSQRENSVCSTLHLLQDNVINFLASLSTLYLVGVLLPWAAQSARKKWAAQVIKQIPISLEAPGDGDVCAICLQGPGEDDDSFSKPASATSDASTPATSDGRTPATSDAMIIAQECVDEWLLRPGTSCPLCRCRQGWHQSTSDPTESTQIDQSWLGARATLEQETLIRITTQGL